MKISLYIFKIYFPLLIGALSLFLLGFEIVDLFMNIWKYIYNNVPVKDVLRILFLYMPKALTFSLPLSMLFATCYMICILSSQNEMIALFASGVSYFKAMLPLIIFALIVSQLYIVFEDKVVVPTYKEYQKLKNSALNIEKDYDQHNIVITSEEGNIIYKASSYNDNEKKLFSLLLVIRDEDKKLNSIIQSNYATWNGKINKWLLNEPLVYKYVDGELIQSEFTDEMQNLISESPDTFRNNEVDIETLSIKDSKKYLSYLKRTGLPSGEAFSIYYKKFSFSYVILIVTILAIGLSGRTRKNIIIVSMILSLFASVLFYVFQMITMLLAKFSIVTPMVGAWFPVIVFMIISFILLRYSKT